MFYHVRFIECVFTRSPILKWMKKKRRCHRTIAWPNVSHNDTVLLEKNSKIKRKKRVNTFYWYHMLCLLWTNFTYFFPIPSRHKSMWCSNLDLTNIISSNNTYLVMYTRTYIKCQYFYCLSLNIYMVCDVCVPEMTPSQFAYEFSFFIST